MVSLIVAYPKVGDTLCKGKPILAYGDIQTGLIEFMKTNEVAYCATSKKELDELIAKLLTGYNATQIYLNQFELAKKNFNVDKESIKFLKLLND